MKILVTGARGFLGKNLLAELKIKTDHEVFLCDKDTSARQLDGYLRECEFVFHLAGVNRPEDPEEFARGNTGFTRILLEGLARYKNSCPVVVCSSAQARFDNPYGRSKKAAEALAFAHAEATSADVYVYRFPNIFGKWGKPHYNSAVATFCHQITRGEPVRVDDPAASLRLVYVGDVVTLLLDNLRRKPQRDENGFCVLPEVYTATVGELVEKLYRLWEHRDNLILPAFQSDFDRKLYSTLISYLPSEKLGCDLDGKYDYRGVFFECLKSEAFGQVSVSVSRPGVVRGNHWHQRKTEKFYVLSGEAVIRLRRLGEQEVTEYRASALNPQAIDIPAGYVHSIQNTGESEMILIIWCGDIFDPENPDTYFEEVAAHDQA